MDAVPETLDDDARPQFEVLNRHQRLRRNEFRGASFGTCPETSVR
jgi:hypothetical protein